MNSFKCSINTVFEDYSVLSDRFFGQEQLHHQLLSGAVGPDSLKAQWMHAWQLSNK
ncbi:MAG: hypothetical protein R6U64_01840 [Bacteroidales bacterium]